MRNLRLAALLGIRKLSIAALARAIGVSEVSVGKWVRLGWRPGSPEARRAVADLLGVEPDFLWPPRALAFGRKSEPESSSGAPAGGGV